MSDIEVPPALSIYAAAFTVALTTDDAYEREGALLLMRELGAESIGEVRARRGPRGGPSRTWGKKARMSALIREVIEERLG